MELLFIQSEMTDKITISEKNTPPDDTLVRIMDSLSEHSDAELYKIAKAYLGKRAETMVFKIQEACRRVAVEYANTYSQDKHIGAGWHILVPLHYAMGFQPDKRIPNHLYRFIIDKWREFYEEDHTCDMSGVTAFYAFVKEIMKSMPTYPENVKELATKCLCWPRGTKEFEPWIPTTINEFTVELDLSKFRFGRTKSGAVVFSPFEEYDGLGEIWKQKDKWMPLLDTKENKKYGFNELVKPKGSFHVTVLTSFEVLHYPLFVDQMIKKYNQLLATHEIKPKINIANVQHTFDERYIYYETVVVFEAECSAVDTFKHEYHKYTSTDPNPGTHITFAVRLRK